MKGPQRKLRVVIWTPAFLGTPAGGHRVQVEKTAEALRASGRVVVDVSEDPQLDLRDFDVVHGFGMPVPMARRVRDAGRPFVMSTVYSSKKYKLRGPMSSSLSEARHRVRSAVGGLGSGLQGRALQRAERLTAWVVDTRAMFEMCDMLLPNSEAEADAIRCELGVTTPMQVVPNGVDPRFLLSSPPAERSGVLMVGRFEPHKNQMVLMTACARIGVPLTLVGPPHPHHEAYYAKCRKRADSLGVRVLCSIRHEELKPLYMSAMVHALPSHFETTGLVSLEAALAGCRIVTTLRGFARDYFGEDAEYCHPHDARDVARAVKSALARPDPVELRERILANYTWNNTAQATMSAYEAVLRS